MKEIQFGQSFKELLVYCQYLFLELSLELKAGRTQSIDFISCNFCGELTRMCPFSKSSLMSIEI
ncbi:MAG TPA: hypothetical protein DIS77_09625 [Rothia sp.]|nr:hypothetical protein [Rothia sp. (in: high G+C Gram-positive bacteria)]